LVALILCQLQQEDLQHTLPMERLPGMTAKELN
jgi:hypothetical protein